MLTSTKSIKSHNNSSSYGSTYYSYYNPSIMSNQQLSKTKRIRVKDSYVELAKEKKDFISYEIVQVKGLSEKNKSRTIYSQPLSCPRFANNKNIKNIKNKFIHKNYEQLSSYRKEINNESDNDENIPYTTTLRNFSTIINNKKFNNLLNNKEKNYNIRKRNNFGNYKISNKIKELLKTGIAKKDKDLNENKKEENSNSVCLEKISIETYTIKNEKNIMIKNELFDINDKIDIIPENKNKTINNNNNSMIEINNNKNLINDESNENINNNKNIEDISFKNSSVKRMLNYEEEKNDESQNKTKYENKLIQTQKMDFFIQKTKSILIKNNKETNNKTKLKNNRLTANVSCPKVLHSNKASSSEEIQDDYLKEKITKILNRNTKFDIKRKKYFLKIDEKKNNKTNYQYINNQLKNSEQKLEELLKKIPQHNNTGRNKSVIQLEAYQQKTFNIKRIKKENIGRHNISSVMPPNNLKEIILKKEMNFLFD